MQVKIEYRDVVEKSYQIDMGGEEFYILKEYYHNNKLVSAFLLDSDANVISDRDKVYEIQDKIK